MRLDDFGPAEKLHAAIRRRAPQMAVSICDGDDGAPLVRVTYRHTGPVIVHWTGDLYRCRRGEGPWTELPADPEDAAAQLAADLGAVTSTPARSRAVTCRPPTPPERRR